MAIVLSLSLLDRSFSVVAAWVFINHLGCNLVLMLLVDQPSPGSAALTDGGGALAHRPPGRGHRDHLRPEQHPVGGLLADADRGLGGLSIPIEVGGAWS